MTAPITWADLTIFEAEMPEDQATAMIATVWSRARRLAPCLKAESTEDNPNPLDDEDNAEMVKGILREAILRWYDKGSGAVAQRIAGEYQETMTSGTGSRGYFRPDEVTSLAELCSTHRSQRAITIVPGELGYCIVHADWCSSSPLFHPAASVTFCECGADLSADGYPLWGPE